MRDLVNTGRAIRLPVHVNSRWSKVEAHKTRLQEKFNRDPTLNELSEVTDLPEEEIAYLLLRGETNLVSLNRPIAGEAYTEFGDLIADTHDFEHEIEATSDTNELNKLFKESDLNPRQLVMVSVHHGVYIDSLKSVTLKTKSGSLTYDQITEIAWTRGKQGQKALSDMFGMTQSKMKDSIKEALHRLGQNKAA